MPEPRTKPGKPAAKRATSETGTTRSVSQEEIARRAYEIAHGDDAGSPEENWLRAERELRGRSTTSG